MTGLRAPVPDPLDAFDGSTFLRNAVLFTRALRSAGVVTDLGGALDFARALTLVEIGDRTQVHAAGSAIFCRRRVDLEIYDAVFDQFWRRHTAQIAPTGPEVGALRPPRPPKDREAALDTEPGLDRPGPPRGRRGAEGRRRAGGRAARLQSR